MHVEPTGGHSIIIIFNHVPIKSSPFLAGLVSKANLCQIIVIIQSSSTEGSFGWLVFAN